MKLKHTPLSRAYNALKPCLFKNQYVFYNIMFNFLIHGDVVAGLPNQINSKYIDDMPFDDDIMKKFYVLITDCCPYPKMKDFITKAEFKMFYEKKPVPAFSGRIVEKNREYKNQTITGYKTRNIPVDWLDRYDKNGSTKLEYCTNIAWIIQFYYIILKSPNNITKAPKNIPVNAVTDSYTEYYSLTDEDRKKLEASTGITINSFIDIAKYIHSAIQDQVSYNKGIGYYAIVDNHAEVSPAKRTSESELKEYNNQIACYGRKNIDRLNVLKRYAASNTLCANELGSIYYFGDTFYSTHEPFIVEKDLVLAAHYYTYCITADIVNPSGCWSLGYMILKGEYSIPDRERLESARELFEKCGEYGPAKNSIAKIERELADNDHKKYNELLNSKNKKNEAELYKLKQSAVEHYVNALNLARIATNYGWLYSYNLIYDILSSNEFAYFHDEIIKHPEYVEMDRIDMLRHAADMENSWSMVTLALELMKDGSNVTEEAKQEAHKLLVKAAKCNYKRALDYLETLF